MCDDVQVETGRIAAVKALHHDKRGDYGMEEVERSPFSYLSTTTTAPSTKAPSLTLPPSTTGSFIMPAKATRLQQHDDVFSRINTGMDLGSPKVPTLIPPHLSLCLSVGLYDADSMPSYTDLALACLLYTDRACVTLFGICVKSAINSLVRCTL